MSDPLQYEEVAEALNRLGLRGDASSLHGALCGALCRMDPDQIDPTQLLEDEPDVVPDVRTRATLVGWLEQAGESISDGEMGFVPLLPNDSTTLTERARALGAWCEGFLFGLAGGAHLDLDRCSEEVRELISDFTQFTRAAYADQDDLEVEEGAYAELVEYIRVGAQLIYMELHPRGGSSGDDAEPAPTIH